jgi:hypothetical protein
MVTIKGKEMTDKKQKQIIVEQVMVTGYVKHSNGRKSPFSYNKTDFDAKDLQSILNGVGRMYG